MLQEKLAIVEKELGWTMEDLGFKRHFDEMPGLYERFSFFSHNRVVYLYLEVREGYLDLEFANLVGLTFNGVDLDWANRQSLSSLRSQLANEGQKLPCGFHWPSGRLKLYDEGVFASTLKTLMDAAMQRADTVLGIGVEKDKSSE